MKEEPNKEYFLAAIPSSLFIDKEITSKAKLLFPLIDQLDNNEVGGCKKTNEYLADFLNMSKSSITRSIKRLQEKGYIVVTFDGNERIIKTNKNVM